MTAASILQCFFPYFGEVFARIVLYCLPSTIMAEHWLNEQQLFLQVGTGFYTKGVHKNKTYKIFQCSLRWSYYFFLATTIPLSSLNWYDLESKTRLVDTNKESSAVNGHLFVRASSKMKCIIQAYSNQCVASKRDDSFMSWFTAGATPKRYLLHDWWKEDK